MSGIRLNTDCAERAADRLYAQVQTFAAQSGEPVTIIGQSRGGTLARVAAVRAPESVSALVMLGSPVLDPLAVSRPVLRTLRSVAWLGDAGFPGMLSTSCRDGACCASYRRDLARPLPPGLTATAIYSRSDGIVSWRACLDPQAEHVEVDSSHTGMSVNPEVYRVLERVLAMPEEESEWSG
jgi:pimeloyl-ACP methyl ester carboxylesterase